MDLTGVRVDAAEARLAYEEQASAEDLARSGARRGAEVAAPGTSGDDGRLRSAGALLEGWEVSLPEPLRRRVCRHLA